MRQRRPPPPASLQVLHRLVALLGFVMLGLWLWIVAAAGWPADPWVALPAAFVAVAAGTVLLVR